MKFNLSLKAVLGLTLGLVFAGIAVATTVFIVMSSNLPKLITVQDYDPLLVSQVYDRKGEQIGEFFREKRILTPYSEIPEVVKQAFISSEDSSFFEHGGINYIAIFRAILANLKAGKRVQGASTITQQVARSLLLTRKKTYTRKIKEIILAHRMEENLTKEEILYLYLNQIYLGQGAYGVEAATKIFFRKELKDITLPEAAMLAGLPKAPSAYSPVRNPKRAKERQAYVLGRMAAEKYVSEEQAKEARDSDLLVYLRKNYKEIAPYYLETVRQMLVEKLGEKTVLDDGIKVYTSLDMQKQLAAQAEVRQGLRNLDKRQGYRGPLKNIESPEEIAKFLKQQRDKLMDDALPYRIVRPDGSFIEKGPLNLTDKYTEADGDKNGQDKENLPEYIKFDETIKAIVTQVDDKWGLVYVRFAESKGLIDLESMKWARQPDPTVNVRYFNGIKKPSAALKKGDIIYIQVKNKRFYSQRLNKELKELRNKIQSRNKEYERPEELPEFKDYALVELEQEPIAQGALISLDQKTSDILAYVGGYDFAKSQFDRALQATRQTGSSFKALVYASALDKGYTAATPITDAPIVYEEEVEAQNNEGENTVKKWKPTNHGKKFNGDILFRNALIRSLNVPTVKIIEDIKVNWVADYAKRLGIFSPLNMDFTLALGSSGVTLYEITKTFSQIGRLGKRIRPMIIHKVENQSGEILLENITLDERFMTEIQANDEAFEKRRAAYLDYKKNPEKYAKKDENTNEDPNRQKDVLNEDLETPPVNYDIGKEPPLFFEDADQLINPTTAYITTSLLRGVIEDERGTGRLARSVGRPLAGKTGSTSSYYDAWFVGYSADIATGVWIGFDEEKTLGKGEVGGRSALPVWVQYMKSAHEGMPVRDFEVPENIVFSNIDAETGHLASTSSSRVIRQPFVEGTEPKQMEDSTDEDQNFFKEELSE